VSWRLAHEAKAGEVACLVLGLLILLWAEGVIAGEVEVAEGSTRTGHHLVELLLIIVPKVVLLLTLTLDAGVVSVVVVLLIRGGVELLPLGAVSDKVGGITTLEAAPRWSPHLLVEPVQSAELSRQQGNLIVRDALVLLIRSYSQRGQGKLHSRWVSSVGGVSHMATNMSNSNKSLTSKRNIMVWMTLPR
jgi:hypothetical protein